VSLEAITMRYGGGIPMDVYRQGGPAKVRPTYILLVTFGT